MFQTRYLPSNHLEKPVLVIGIQDHFNCYSFKTGIVRAWLRLWVVSPCRNTILNALLRIRMAIIARKSWKPFVAQLKDTEATQKRLLGDILRLNKSTQFGRDFSFDEISTYETFRARVAVQNYETLNPYVTRQQTSGLAMLSVDEPIIYAKTSGTTGAAKYIPIGKTSLNLLRQGQNIASYCNYLACPDAYKGKLMAIISPAIEGYLPNGGAFGSASGLIVKNMPKVAQEKYVLPWEIFEIENHETKYAEIIKIGLCHKDITFLGTANPSTLLLLLNTINQQRWELLDAIKHQTISAHLPKHIEDAIKRKAVMNRVRVRELEVLFKTKERLEFKDLWPDLKLPGYEIT